MGGTNLIIPVHGIVVFNILTIQHPHKKNMGYLSHKGLSLLE